jgi:hypothetical protein
LIDHSCCYDCHQKHLCGEDEEEDTDTIHLAEVAIDKMTDPRLQDQFGETSDTVFKALDLLIDVEQSYTYPFPHVKLPCGPSLLFPIKNEITGSTIWVELTHSGSAVSIIVHKEKPNIKDASQQSNSTAMAGVHLDYYMQHNQEILQVMLHDEAEGPYNEASWVIPNEYCAAYPNVPILLVENVQAWKPCSNEE